MIHGNETGNLPGVLDFLNKLITKKNRPGVCTVFLGNIEAALRDQRFFEQDLNRVFIDTAPESWEKNRAREISRLFTKDISLYLDFHQTLEPTDRSFYTFGFQQNLYNWARALKTSRTLVTRKSTESFASGLRGATEYAFSQGITALTLETGARGLNKKSAALCLKTLENAWNLIQLDQKAFEKKVKAAPALEVFVRVHAEKFSDAKMALKSGLKNFQVVKKNQTVGKLGSGVVLKAPQKGFVLFPKYPARHPNGEVIEPRPSDLYLLVNKQALRSLL